MTEVEFRWRVGYRQNLRLDYYQLHYTTLETAMTADELNPWRTLSSRIVYENHPWLSVREDEVIRPDGAPGLYSVVQTRIATGVVAINSNNEVVLVGQYRYPLQQYSWEIVEGGADDGESPLEAIRRELREEAGLLAQSWIQLGAEIHLSNCFTDERAYVFLARDLQQVTAEPDGTEILKTRLVPFAECLSLVEAGQITDALSIIGILRAASHVADLTTP